MGSGVVLDMEGWKAWCGRNNVQFMENPQLGQLGIPTPLGDGFMLRVIPRPERNMVTLAMPLPLPIPPALIQEVARATALVNSGLYMGAWVLNHGKGELYFRLSLPTEGVMYQDDTALFLLNVVIGTVSGVGDGFRLIVQEGAPAESIVSHLAGPPSSDDAEEAGEAPPEEG